MMRWAKPDRIAVIPVGLLLGNTVKATAEHHPVARLDRDADRQGQLLSCSCPMLFRWICLEDVGGHKDDVVLSVVLMPVHSRPGLSGRIARVEGM